MAGTITHVGTNSYSSGNTSGGSSKTPTVSAPAGLQVGDLLVWNGHQPSGGSGAAWNGSFPLYYRFAQAGDIGASFSASSDIAVGAVLTALRGVDTVDWASGSVGTSNTMTSYDRSTTRANAAILYGVTNYDFFTYNASPATTSVEAPLSLLGTGWGADNNGGSSTTIFRANYWESFGSDGGNNGDGRTVTMNYIADSFHIAVMVLYPFRTNATKTVTGAITPSNGRISIKNVFRKFLGALTPGGAMRKTPNRTIRGDAQKFRLAYRDRAKALGTGMLLWTFDEAITLVPLHNKQATDFGDTGPYHGTYERLVSPGARATSELPDPRVEKGVGIHLNENDRVYLSNAQALGEMTFGLWCASLTPGTTLDPNNVFCYRIGTNVFPIQVEIFRDATNNYIWRYSVTSTLGVTSSVQYNEGSGPTGWNLMHFSRGADGILRIYKNGTEVAASAVASGAPNPNTGSIFVGCENASSFNGATGIYDEFTIFWPALTASQITSLYTAVTNVFYGGAITNKMVSAIYEGVITPAAALIKRITKGGLAGSITPSGTLIRTLLRTLLGFIAPTGAITKKDAAIHQEGTVAFEGILTKFWAITTPFTGAITPTQTFVVPLVKNPTSISSSWDNSIFVTASDDQRATRVLSTGQISSELSVHGFGFNLPVGAEILGIEVRIERRGTGSGNDIRDNVVRLQTEVGTLVGTNKATNSSWPSADEVAVYGGPDDLWGTTFTRAQVNASQFGVEVRARGAAAGTAEVDHIQMTVTYQVPGTLLKQAQRLFGGTTNPFGAITRLFQRGHFVAVGDAGTTTVGSSITVPVPAQTLNGDEMLLAVSSAQVPTATPAGWTLIANDTALIAYSARLYRRTANAEPASYTVNFPVAGSAVGRIIVYRNVAYADVATNEGSLVTSVDVTEDEFYNGVRVAVAMASTNEDTSATGFTERADSGVTGARLGLSDRETDSATTAVTSTISRTSAGALFGAVVAFRGRPILHFKSSIASSGSSTRRQAFLIIIDKMVGALTPSGLLGKHVTASHEGSLSPIGVLRMEAGFFLTGVINSVGDLWKKPIKTFTGSTDPMGLLRVIAQKYIILASAITSSGSVTKAVSTFKSGVITPFATVRKDVRMTLLGVIVAHSSLSRVRTVYLALAGVITSSGGVTRFYPFRVMAAYLRNHGNRYSYVQRKPGQPKWRRR